MYKRTLSEIIIKSFKEGFVTIIYGARRVGKTVLLGQIRKIIGDSDILSFNGDTSESVDALNTNSEVKLTKLVENHGTIFIDEGSWIILIKRPSPTEKSIGNSPVDFFSFWRK